MNEIERARLADNLTTAADWWTTADLEFVIGVLQTILATRTGADLTHKAYRAAINRTLHGKPGS